MYFRWTSGANFLTHIEVSSSLNQKELAMRRLVWCQRLPNRRGEKTNPDVNQLQHMLHTQAENALLPCFFQHFFNFAVTDYGDYVTDCDNYITDTFLILRSTWKFSLCTLIQMPFSCFLFLAIMWGEHLLGTLSIFSYYIWLPSITKISFAILVHILKIYMIPEDKAEN